jgi:hypothetical protein
LTCVEIGAKYSPNLPPTMNTPFIFIFQILEYYKKNDNKNLKLNKVNPNLISSLKPLLVGLTYHDIHVVIPSCNYGITPKDVCKFC